MTVLTRKLTATRKKINFTHPKAILNQCVLPRQMCREFILLYFSTFSRNFPRNCRRNILKYLLFLNVMLILVWRHSSASNQRNIFQFSVLGSQSFEWKNKISWSFLFLFFLPLFPRVCYCINFFKRPNLWFFLTRETAKIPKSAKNFHSIFSENAVLKSKTWVSEIR